MAQAQQVQTGAVFNQQGPAPATGPRDVVGSADAPPNGTVTGAIQAIAADPNDPNTLYVAAVNGGVWKSTNGGSSWAALTDGLSSLSIASLGLDPTDASNKTLIAGVGNTSNGGWSSLANFNSPRNFGGNQNGLLYSTDGGATFTHLGGAALANQTVVDVAARGSTILAATFEPRAVQAVGNWYSGGLYRSTNGGASFSQVSGGVGTGLPAGPVTSMVGDPTSPNTFYAAVTANSGATFDQTAVYRSTDGGATWAPVFGAANSGGTITAGGQTTIKLAAGPNGTVVIGVIDLGTKAISGLFYSSSSGGSWNQLTTPPVNGGGQAPVNIALAIDRTSPNLIYVSGDNNYGNNGGINAVSIVRINASNNTTSLISDDTATPVNTANGSTVHPDSRALVLDSSGRLLIGVDGGIFVRTSPQNSSGTWTGLNMSLSIMEIYSLAYDANSKRLVIAAQDNGTSFQATSGGLTFNQLQSGDGINARVNDRSFGTSSALYTTTQELGEPTRRIVDASGTITYTAPINFVGGAPASNFTSALILNNIDPTKIVIGGQSNVYVTQDNAAVDAATVDLTLTNVGAVSVASTYITAVDYGTANNVNAVVAGAGPYNAPNGSVYISTTGTANSLVQTAGYSGLAPTSVKFDTRSDQRFFAADSVNLYGTVNQGTTFTNLTGNLPANLIRPTSLGFINNNGVAALLVGGLNNADNAGNQIAVADSSATGDLSGWRRFGSGLPNALVYDLSYNAKSDTLAVGTVGRGAFLLYDVTSNFLSAAVLQFGLADNDSIPDASVLTGNRPLIKYGTGTLQITGAASYTGGTTIDAGTLMLGNGGTTGSILGDVVNDGVLAFNRSDRYAFTGQISGTGSLRQIGTGVTVLSANETYTGSTAVVSGGLIVNGSIASSSGLIVDSGALIGGNGTLPSATINGILSPGNSIGTITVNGNLSFGTGATYAVEVSPTTSDKTNVTGTASLAGTVQASYATGSYISKRYNILNAKGGVTGTFGGLVNSNLPANFSSALGYDATNAYLDLSLAFSNFSSSLSRNQQQVANALINSFNTAGGIPTVFGTLSPNGLTQVSGETGAALQQSLFGNSELFMRSVFDNALGWSGGASVGGCGNGGSRDACAAMPVKALPAFASGWTLWGAGYGGTLRAGGDAATGSHDTTSRVAGAAAGATYQLAPDARIGFALGGAGGSFGLAQGLGTGRSDDFNAALYGRKEFGPSYFAAALGYVWQQAATDRTVTAAGADVLHADLHPQALVARVEGGRRYQALGVGMTPYAALQTTSMWLPSYGETATSRFGLAYDARNTTITRTELGAKVDNDIVIAGRAVNLTARAAWLHGWGTDWRADAALPQLAAARFTVFGAALSGDSAQVSLGAGISLGRGWSASANFDGEFWRKAESYTGRGLLRYQW